MNEDERVLYRSLLAMVLKWRNFDGDGITDPLRAEIKRVLGRFVAPEDVTSQPSGQFVLPKLPTSD